MLLSQTTLPALYSSVLLWFKRHGLNGRLLISLFRLGNMNCIDIFAILVYGNSGVMFFAFTCTGMLTLAVEYTCESLLT